jgi:hypothetical protein
MLAAFPDNITVVLPHARHYIQEDTPQEMAQVIAGRFGERRRLGRQRLRSLCLPRTR